MDPTRTLSLRRAFMRELSKAFRNLRRAVKDFMVEKDALGLKEKKHLVPFQTIALHVQPREFEFRTDAQKLGAFNDWFRQQVEANVLSPDPGTPAGTPWTTEFVESAYRRGQFNAFISSRTITGTDQSSESFLKSSFAQPETMSKVQLLGTRAFEQLRGITATMSSEMNRILAQGIADGRGAEDLARELGERIGSLAGSRALTIARTEIINAHAEGQLDAFNRLGVQELGIKAEWSTAGDDRVCELCLPMEGQVFTIEQARGMIPLHPNCVLGDSLIECPDALFLTRAKYHGRVIHLTTLHNRRLSVTEHHVLLTRGGWCLAKDLRQGDCLIGASSVDSTFIEHPDKNDGVASISNVFETISKILPKHLRRISGTRPQYFHGDGGALDEEIDVILSDCELRGQFHSLCLAQAKKLFLMGGDVSTRQPLFLDGESSLSLLLERLAAAADCLLSRKSIPAILARGSSAGHQPIALSEGSYRNPCEDKSCHDHVTTTMEDCGDLVEALPAEVAFDEIVDVQIVESGRGGVFVFDVSTHSSMYSVNGILSSNCRCTWIPTSVT